MDRSEQEGRQVDDPRVGEDPRVAGEHEDEEAAVEDERVDRLEDPRGPPAGGVEGQVEGEEVAGPHDDHEVEGVVDEDHDRDDEELVDGPAVLEGDQHVPPVLLPVALDFPQEGRYSEEGQQVEQDVLGPEDHLGLRGAVGPEEGVLPGQEQLDRVRKHQPHVDLPPRGGQAPPEPRELGDKGAAEDEELHEEDVGEDDNGLVEVLGDEVRGDLEVARAGVGHPLLRPLVHPPAEAEVRGHVGRAGAVQQLEVLEDELRDADVEEHVEAREREVV